MRRKGSAVFLLAAVVLAVVAYLGAHRYISAQARRAAANKVVTAPVVVAKENLPGGQALEAVQLTVQHWPVENLPPGRFGRVEDIVGRVINGPVVQGEVILAAKLAPKGMAGGLSAIIPPGARAVTVRVDEVIGVAGFVQPNDRVDVIAIIDSGIYQEDPISQVILQDVEVLTVGQKTEAGDKDKKARVVSVATLNLDQWQAERLALAANRGKILLALRNQSDRTSESPKGVHMTTLFPLAKASTPPPATAAPVPPPPPPPPTTAPPVKAPPPPPPPPPTVEVIKGIERQTQKLQGAN